MSVESHPLAALPTGKSPVTRCAEASVGCRTGLDRRNCLTTTGVRTAYLQTCSQSLHRLCCPDEHNMLIHRDNNVNRDISCFCSELPNILLFGIFPFMHYHFCACLLISARFHHHVAPSQGYSYLILNPFFLEAPCIHILIFHPIKSFVKIAGIFLLERFPFHFSRNSATGSTQE